MANQLGLNALMTRQLQVLIVEDSKRDAELLVEQLGRNGYQIEHERVESAAEMSAALDRRAWDLVLADYSMPEFNGLQALELMRARHLDIPFITVSGSFGEELAVDMMKAGAGDYIMKTRLVRLVPAIERELDAAQNRRARAHAESAVQHLAAIVETSEDAIYSKTLDGTIVSWNKSAERIYGYTAGEIIGRSITILFPSDRPSEFHEITERIRRGDRLGRYETVRVCKDGRHIQVALTVSPIKDSNGKTIGASAIARDITEAKRDEQERLRLISELTDALTHVQQLKGLLPICAACKKIRDDGGYWQQVETYIESHTQAHFTHGICPECMKRLYPEYQAQVAAQVAAQAAEEKNGAEK